MLVEREGDCPRGRAIHRASVVAAALHSAAELIAGERTVIAPPGAGEHKDNTNEVEEGDTVYRGQVLATLDAGPYEDSVRAAEAQVAGLKPSER